jgi:hypothetical protein
MRGIERRILPEAFSLEVPIQSPWILRFSNISIPLHGQEIRFTVPAIPQARTSRREFTPGFGALTFAFSEV